MTWRPALWLVAIVVVALDQATKIWALAALEPGVRHQLLGDFLSLTLVFNSGAAFSLGADYTWIVTVVMVVVTGGIVYFARRAQSRLAVAMFGIGLGGAVGNLIDRLFREPSFGQGHVIDMINYNGWFVGNVADIAIVGVAAVILMLSFGGKSLLSRVPVDEWAAQDDTAQKPTAASDVSGASGVDNATERDEPRG